MIYIVRKIYSPETYFLMAVLLIIMILGVLPAAVEGVEHWSSGVGILDAEWFYSPSELKSRMALYGKEGREAYLFMLLSADLFFPILYSVFFVMILFPLLSLLPSFIKKKMLLFPLVPGFFDLLENTGLALSLWLYPRHFSALAWLASACTFLKWTSLALLFMTLFYLLGLWLWKRF